MFKKVYKSLKVVKSVDKGAGLRKIAKVGREKCFLERKKKSFEKDEIILRIEAKARVFCLHWN